MNIEFNIIIYVDGKKCKFLCTFPSWLRLPNDKNRLRENVGESLAMGLQKILTYLWGLCGLYLVGQNSYFQPHRLRLSIAKKSHYFRQLYFLTYTCIAMNFTPEKTLSTLPISLRICGKLVWYYFNEVLWKSTTNLDIHTFKFIHSHIIH